MDTKNKTALVDINEITECYLPICKRNARKFVYMYLQPIKIGNRIYVDREQLESLLHDSNIDDFPLHF